MYYLGLLIPLFYSLTNIVIRQSEDNIFFKFKTVRYQLPLDLSCVGKGHTIKGSVEGPFV